jgi:hypothetical protein
MLMTRIRHHIRPGTILISDMWCAYGGIRALPQCLRPTPVMIAWNLELVIKITTHHYQKSTKSIFIFLRSNFERKRFLRNFVMGLQLHEY